MVALGLLCLAIWATTTSALTFTNSFAGWVVNATYTITWDSSKSDPNYFDLVLARPHNITDAGVEVSSTWPMDWATNVLTQIPSNGDHFYKFTLPPDCRPGYYYWVLQTDKNIPASTTFYIASSSELMATSSQIQSTATISSFVPVTATENVIGTSDGQLVTFKPSDVFSSAIVYTTIIVSGGGGKGMPPSKVHMIVGVSLAALFMVTMPIVVWLVLRYRRQPAQLSNSDGSDKRLPLSDAESLPNSSTLDLLTPNSARSNSAANSSSASTEGTRQVWAIVDGEKRQITVPRYPPRPAPPAVDQDPFADPVVPPRRQSLPRIAIPHNVIQSNNSTPSSSTTPVDTLLSRGNTTTSHTAPSRMYILHEASDETQDDPLSSTTHLTEKAPRPRRQRPTQEAQPLSPEEVAARIFIPGRAVDMGPLGRDRLGDVDENGLLPPDYSQATQPLSSSQQPPQAGPGAR